MLNKSNLLYFFLYLGLFSFYIITPLTLSQINYKMWVANGYNIEITILLDLIKSIFEKQIFLFLILLFYIIALYLILKILRYDSAKDKIIENNNINKAILILVIPCLILLTIDLIQIFYFVYDLNFEMSKIRDKIYLNFLDQRKTHINLLIILTPLIFNVYRKTSTIIYLLIVFYAFLSLSRFELILLFLVHVNLNIKINYRNFLWILIIISFIVFMRVFVSYDFKISNEYLLILFNQTTIESIHVFISNITAIEYIKNVTIIEYINQNIKFLSNNFFYTNYDIISIPKQTLEYFQSDKNHLQMYSTSGFSTILIFFPIFILQTLILLFLLNKINNKNISKVYIFFLLLFLFRGHFVHTCLFLVKLSLLLLFLLWIIKKLQMLNFKVE